jgi:hypothetical protein
MLAYPGEGTPGERTYDSGVVWGPTQAGQLEISELRRNDMKKRFGMLALLMALLTSVCTLAVAAPTLKAASANPFTNIPVTGTFTDANGPGTFSGTLDIQRFASAGGRNVTAIGALNGTLTEATGATSQVVNQSVSLPVQRTASPTSAAATTGCSILSLVLGPLNLNLLGLQVTLNQVNLNINAIPGAGNLLGNLLCSVAHLLDGNASGAAVSALLNHILGIVSGLLGGL